MTNSVPSPYHVRLTCAACSVSQGCRAASAMPESPGEPCAVTPDNQFRRGVLAQLVRFIHRTGTPDHGLDPADYPPRKLPTGMRRSPANYFVLKNLVSTGLGVGDASSG